MKKLCLLFLLVLSFQLCWAQSDSIPLKVGYTPAPPFIIEENGNLTGINIWLWNKLASDLDLKYELQSMEFSEMLTGLEENEIDISINPLTITGGRAKKMEFTYSYFATNSTIVIPQKNGFQKFYQFVKSFFNFNFLKGLLFLVFIISLFGVVGWFFERKKNEQFRSGFRGIWDGLWWSAVTLTTVGYGDKAPISRSGKILALVLMFGGLLFISGLTARIASELTLNEISGSTTNFADFKKLRVGTISNSSSLQFLKNHFFKDLHGYENVGDGLEALQQGELDAFIYDEPILRNRIKNDEVYANLAILPIEFDLQFYAFGISEAQSELESRISQKIAEIMESFEWQVILNEYGLSEI